MATLIVVGVLAFIGQQIWPENPFAEWRNPDAWSYRRPIQRSNSLWSFPRSYVWVDCIGLFNGVRVLGFINFAHGEVFMVGTMSGWIMSEKLNDAGLWESNFILSLFL